MSHDGVCTMIERYGVARLESLCGRLVVLLVFLQINAMLAKI